MFKELIERIAVSLDQDRIPYMRLLQGGYKDGYRESRQRFFQKSRNKKSGGESIKYLRSKQRYSTEGEYTVKTVFLGVVSPCE